MLSPRDRNLVTNGDLPVKAKETPNAGGTDWALEAARQCYAYMKSQDGGMGEASMENMATYIRNAAMVGAVRQPKASLPR